MGRKTLWVSPIFLFFPIERTDRSFPAERKKKLFFLFFFRAGFCRIVVSFRRHMQLMLCVRYRRPPPPVGAAWCRHSTCSQKSQSQGPPYLHAIKSLWWKNKAPATLRLGSLLSESPSFFLFVVLRYPLPRLRYARRDGPSSGLFRHALFFPSSSSSSSSFYWNVLSFLSFFLLSLWFVLPAHSCYDSMRKTKWKRGKFHSFEK